MKTKIGTFLLLGLGFSPFITRADSISPKSNDINQGKVNAPASQSPKGVDNDSEKGRTLKPTINATTPDTTTATNDFVIRYNETKAKAEAGDAAAQYRMSRYPISTPTSSIPQDQNSRLKWLTLSANQRYVAAMNGLAAYYLVKSNAENRNADLVAESLKWKILSFQISGKGYAPTTTNNHVSQSTFDEAQRRADLFLSEKKVK